MSKLTYKALLNIDRIRSDLSVLAGRLQNAASALQFIDTYGTEDDAPALREALSEVNRVIEDLHNVKHTLYENLCLLENPED